MTDSLDDLLSSCSLASRSIRLLTAEIKRRAFLLRACCSEYELALDRLDGLRQDVQLQDELELGLEYEHEIAQAAARDLEPPAGPDPDPDPDADADWHREAGKGRLSTRHVASPTAAISARFQGLSSEVSTTPQTTTKTVGDTSSRAEQGLKQGSVSMDPYTSEEALRITKSLEEILEQARTIRTSNGPKQVGTAGAGAGAGAGAPSSCRARVTPATATAAERAATATPSKSTVGGRVKSGASSSIRSGGGRGVGKRTGRVSHGGHGHSTSTNTKAIPPAAVTATSGGHSKAKAAGAAPVSSASRRSRAGTFTSGVGQSIPVPGHLSSTRHLRDTNTRSAGKVAHSTLATSSHSGGSSCAPGPRGVESAGRRVGARRPSSSSSPSRATQPGCPENPGEQEQEQEVAGPRAVVTSSTSKVVAANLDSGLWKEVARYEAARRRFIGWNENDSSNSACDKNGSGGGRGASVGGEAAKGSRQDMETAEEILLRGLDSGSDFSSSGSYPQGQNGAQPDPHFLGWRALQLSRPQLAPTAERDFHSRNDRGTGGAGSVDPQCREEGKGNVVESERTRAWVGLERLEEVSRLQLSLLMLLDELEGTRELLAHEEQQRMRKVATKGGSGSDGRRAERDGGRGGRGGMDRALQEFEDWYCWNKVAHVTGLLRERLDAMSRGVADGTGGGGQASLSEEAKYLCENPSLMLAGENPLRSLSKPHDDDDSGWRSAWQQSNGVQDLRGTACRGVVEELQASAPSCWPHDSNSASGHTAELFAQQVRTTSILAAETDISRLVMPALARELSQASQASVPNRPPDKPSRFSTNAGHVGMQPQVQHAVEEITTHARMSCADGVLDDAECLRERVLKRPVPAGKRASCGEGDDHKREEELWAPALAVFRAVGAVLSGDGRSKISFVYRGSTGEIGNI